MEPFRLLHYLLDEHSPLWKRQMKDYLAFLRPPGHRKADAGELEQLGLVAPKVRPAANWARIGVRTVVCLYVFSGLAYLVSKFFRWPPDIKNPTEGPAWLLGIYIAVFGIAYQKYHDSVTTEHARFEKN
jgi:hypothetical protein